MEPGGSTHSLRFAGKSVIFILVVFLLMLSLLSTLDSMCLEGRDVAVLVPVQVDAVNRKNSEFVRICFAGFLFWGRKSLAMPLPLVRCWMVLWVTVELQSSCAWLGYEHALTASCPC